MSSLAVAPEATSTKPRVAVIGRETLWSGGTVEIRIPADVAIGVYDAGEIVVPYLRFARNIKGGVINVFVHADDDSCCGSTITAEVSVMKKVLDDGRQYLYVDLKPVARSEKVTHRLAMMSNEPELAGSPDWVVFETPPPLRGAVILTPADAKLAVRALPLHAVNTQALPAALIGTTNDKQLDRVLADGWKIESQTKKTVHLFKMRGGERRELVHHRPK